ncbi:hypothetical protein ACHAXS_007195 [Conticribra weissflogii]
MLMSYPGCLRIKVVSFIVGIISKIIVVTSEVHPDTMRYTYNAIVDMRPYWDNEKHVSSFYLYISKEREIPSYLVYHFKRCYVCFLSIRNLIIEK